MGVALQKKIKDSLSNPANLPEGFAKSVATLPGAWNIVLANGPGSTWIEPTRFAVIITYVVEGMDSQYDYERAVYPRLNTDNDIREAYRILNSLPNTIYINGYGWDIKGAPGFNWPLAIGLTIISAGALAPVAGATATATGATAATATAATAPVAVSSGSGILSSITSGLSTAYSTVSAGVTSAYGTVAGGLTAVGGAVKGLIPGSDTIKTGEQTLSSNAASPFGTVIEPSYSDTIPTDTGFFGTVDSLLGTAKSGYDKTNAVVKNTTGSNISSIFGSENIFSLKSETPTSISKSKTVATGDFLSNYWWLLAGSLIFGVIILFKRR